MKQLEVLVPPPPPPGWDASPSQVTSPQFVRFPQQFAHTRLYTWMERGTVGVKCLAQEHNTMSPARAYCSLRNETKQNEANQNETK